MLVNVKVKPSFLRVINSFVDATGTDRSQFIRDAIREKIERMGGPGVDVESTRPPSRLGVGGPKPSSASSGLSKAGKAVDRLIEEVVAEVKQRRRRPVPRG